MLNYTAEELYTAREERLSGEQHAVWEKHSHIPSEAGQKHLWINCKPWLFFPVNLPFCEINKKTWVTSDDIEGLVASPLSLFVTCLNPDGLCLSLLAVIPYRVQMLLALNSSSSPTRAQQARVSEASSQARGKHYTITLTCSTAMVTYLMNKSHHRALDNFDTAPLLLWQTSASLSIFLSLLLLLFFLFFFFFHCPSLRIPSHFLHLSL